ncbi:phage major capsid protein [Pseudonocardia sp. WMMC193]|uniref:phage major capsid protein n=1 Tax=Pseudonocardia sp. WMMC193 TaxID=2911965 RepID=UPI001F01321A|nr:phage major capsid protein [Pseudonocardia sp. WMMC193]MCF7550977.1 phage major capsid protein [Pseudonocardia sp. WMMC193]
MNLRQQRKALLDEARAIGSKAREGNRDLTDDEVARIETIKGEVDELTKKIDAAGRASKALDDLSDVDNDADDDSDDDSDDGGSGGSGKASSGSGGDGRKGRYRTRDRKAGATFGDRFIGSEAYKAFQKNHPGGAGNGTPISIGRVKAGSLEEWHDHRKATLTLDVGRVQPIRLPTIDQVDRDRLTLLDLIARGNTDGNFEYVQVTGVTRNAAIVAEGQLKPLSDLQTNLADAKVYTYADGYDVTNQLLSNAPAFASYMNSELEYSLDNVVEEVLLNGSGTNGIPKGLLNTTGVQHQAFDTDMVTTVRKAITKVTRIGGSVTAVLLSPEDDEKWDLLQDANQRYYGQGPFGSGPGTAWGRPRAVSERLAEGQVILGDFKQIQLLDYEGLSVLAFNQHKDYAQRNMVYVRAELSAAQVIWKPNRLVTVDVEA